MVQPITRNKTFTVQLSNSQTHCAQWSWMWKVPNKDGHIANCILSTTCMEMPFKSLYSGEFNTPLPPCLLFLNIEEKWQIPCSSSEEMKPPHPGKQDWWKNMWMNDTFLILLHYPKDWFKRGTSLRLVTHPNMNLRGAPPSHKGWDKGPAQRDMTNARSARGPQAGHSINPNLSMAGFWLNSSSISSLKDITQ